VEHRRNIMNRLNRITFFAALVAAATLVQAHFVFIVPSQPKSDGTIDTQVFLSETLQPDAGVSIDIVAGAKLSSRAVSGADGPLTLTKAADGQTFMATSPSDTAAIHGIDDLGVNSRGGKANWLIYYPKAVVGDALAKPVVIGEAMPVELVTGGKPGAATLDFVVGGKPKANAEITILFPDGTEKAVMTDANGRTPPLDQAGRYGAWARDWLDTPGEHDGKAYEQVRRYATIVFDVPSTNETVKATTVPTSQPVVASASSNGPSAQPNPHGSAPAGRNPHAAAPKRPLVKAEPFGIALPEAASSFGAVALDGWLYVYGGHIAPTHEYSTKAVSGRFHRLDIAGRGTWADLPAGPGLQGMNLAAYGGKVCRIGGMQPINAPGEPVDNRSVADAACFDPATAAWQLLPPLPEPRSSHDLAVIGDKLFVLGGWNLQGSMTDAKSWPDTMLSLDLRSPSTGWVATPQPFQRRALIAAVHQGKLFAIGGFDSDDRPSRRVDIFDPRTQSWSRGPGLPGEAMNGFSPAACVLDNRLFVSVGDGSLYRLNDDENIWEPVGSSTPRIVHRLIASGSRILIIGGATKGDNLALIEAIDVSSPSQPVTAQRVAPSAPETTTLRALPTLSSALAAAFAKQTHCPVMKEEEVGKASVVVMYRDVPIKLCCATCVKRWNANPEKYADVKLLPQLALASQASPTAHAAAPAN
jgi:hypothetical protein